MHMLVILVPVIFGFMGFAVDLGRIYMIKGELKSASEAAALAAAGQLIGTDAATGNATTAAAQALAEASGLANRYDFGGRTIAESDGSGGTGALQTAFYETVEAAAVTGEGGAEASGSSTARHAQVTLTADAPLVFFAFLPQGQQRSTPVQVRAVAGMSAPLCTACGIVSIAVPARDASDTTDFGFVPGDRYTLGYSCLEPGTPPALPGGGLRVPYLLINRLNAEAELFAEESTQAFRIGAGGLPDSTSEAVSCVSYNAVEQVWAGASPPGCNENRVPVLTTALLCGLATRLETGVAEGCAGIAEVETAAGPFSADTDTADLSTYNEYTGNLRRLLTVAIVDSISDPLAMTVLGFRQFLLQPAANTANLNPTDSNGRFIVTYAGSSAPLRQGRFAGCSLAAGPGKVVLHQ